MEVHKLLLVCSILLLSLLQVNVAEQEVYVLTPITEWDKDKPTPVTVDFSLLVPKAKLQSLIESSRVANISFNVSTQDEHLSINLLSRNIIVKPTGTNTLEYEGSFTINVRVDFEDTMLTEDLSVKLSCTSNVSVVCDDKEHSVVIVHSIQILTVSATPTVKAAKKIGFVDVTVLLTKDLETSSSLKLSVALKPEGVNNVTSERNTDSKGAVMFPNISWGEYELSVVCSEDCSSLKDHIVFPTMTVSAHPSWSQLGELLAGQASTIDSQKDTISSLNNTVNSLKAKLGQQKNNDSSTTMQVPSIATTTASADPTTIATTDIISTVTTEPLVRSTSKSSVLTSPTPTSVSEPSTSPPSPSLDPGNEESTEADTTVASSYLSTEYMKWSVVVLIAILACALLGFLGYQYRLMIKEWVCSKKEVVSSHIPLSLRRSPGSGGGANKYTRLPRTMQEALHQD